MRACDLLDAAAPEAQRRKVSLVAMADARMRTPLAFPHFTDFLNSEHHTRRMGQGRMPPGFAHFPIAYNGRASTVRVADTVRRPQGTWRDGEDEVRFGPEPRLDFELELGVVLGRGIDAPLGVAAAAARIFGLCLLNDWSARGIQMLESLPLGPFMGKSFATTISPWIVTMAALAPFRGPAQPHGVPAHLQDAADQEEGGLDLALRATLRSAAMRARHEAPFVLTRSNAGVAYWTLAQMVAHLASNGGTLLPGELLGTGTLSGAEDASRACLAEINARGTASFSLPDGTSRLWLEDGDEVALYGRAERPGCVPIGFGPCVSVVA